MMEHYNTCEMKELLQKHGFTFSKAMGQNFLIDQNVPEKLVRLSGVDKTFGVLEVGPGLGPLTLELCRAARRVAAVELDKRLVPLLCDTLAGHGNADIIQGDILKLNIADLLTEKMPGLRYAVCANLPYNITTPALTAFISAGMFETITVMIQREVARRICATPGSAEYGAFTVYANYHTQPKMLFDVPPECFMPRPKVYSSVIAMKTRLEKPLCGDAEKLFFRVVRASFEQRRKTLVNALSASFGNTISKAELSDIVRTCGFDDRVRGETLGIPEFVRISETIAARLT